MAYRDDDDNDDRENAVVRAVSTRRRTDSDSERSLTQAEINEIIAAQRKSDASAEREKLLHKMEMKFVEMIGADGEGGDFAVMQEKLATVNSNIERINATMIVTTEKLSARLERVEMFSVKAKWTIVIISPIAGSVAAIAFALVERWIAK